MSDQNKTKQFNFNSFVGIVCAALVGLAITKLDTLNKASIEQGVNLRVLADHVQGIDAKINDLITRSEFSAALSQRDREIEALKKTVESLQHVTNQKP